MKTMSLMSFPHVVPSPSDLRSSSEPSLRYFRFREGSQVEPTLEPEPVPN